MTPGPWKLGPRGTVIAEQEPVGHPLLFVHSPNEVSYYGGYLVAESISSDEDGRLIAAAPAMRDALMVVLARMDEPERDWLRDTIRGLLRQIASEPEPSPLDATRDDLDPPVPDTDDNPEWPA